jgi:transcriptional regulator with XRE-family HTH domain
MTLLSDRLLELRKQKKLSREEASELLHVDRETLARYERGNRVPQAEFIGEAARVYGVSADFLLGLSTSTDNNKAPAETKPGEGANDKQIDMTGWLTIPIVSREWTACCGAGISAADITNESEGAIKVDRKMFYRLDDRRMPFAIYCDGDCLESANIRDGYLAVINPAEEPMNGAIALVSLAGSLSLKYFNAMPNGDVLLRSDRGSRRLTAEEMDRDEFAVLGVLADVHQGRPKILPL